MMEVRTDRRGSVERSIVMRCKFLLQQKNCFFCLMLIAEENGARGDFYISAVGDIHRHGG